MTYSDALTNAEKRFEPNKKRRGGLSEASEAPPSPCLACNSDQCICGALPSFSSARHSKSFDMAKKHGKRFKDAQVNYNMIQSVRY